MADSEIEAASGVWSNGVFRFTLSKPITAFDEPLTELRLREPTSADLIAVGNPVETKLYLDPPLIKVDDARMASMIVRLADIPLTSVQRMALKDMLQIQAVLTPFFLPL